jgi:exopolysaccharide biosynthesis polyprenyl glycosylphosphotransferase
VSSAVSPQPTGNTSYVSRLIPGTASKGFTRKSNGSIGATGEIHTFESLFRSEKASKVRLQDLLFPSPMRAADGGWFLFWAVASDYLAILASWASVCVLVGIKTQPAVFVDPQTLSRILIPTECFRLALVFAVTTTLLAYSEGVYQATETRSRQTRLMLKSFAWSSALLWCMRGTTFCLGAGAFSCAVLLSLASVIAVRRIRSKLLCATRHHKRNVLIVGAGPAGRAVAAYLADHPEGGRVFRGFLDSSAVSSFGVLGRPEDLGHIARAEFIDEVIVALSGQRETGQCVIQQALRNHLDVKIIPDLLGSDVENSFLECWGSIPLLSLHRERLPATRLFFKRVLDVVISSGALLATAPLMALIAILIRLDSAGPVLYTAPRVGRKARRFRCFKFRTMTARADQERERLREKNQRDGPCFKMAGDPRITHVGHFLRRYSLDELPQLWNVLRGEMSLVGPRPHPLDDVARYEIDHLRRLDVTPGLTGLWQVSARQSRSFQTNLALDLEYIQSWSLWMDLRILVKTLSVVLQGTGV